LLRKSTFARSNSGSSASSRSKVTWLNARKSAPANVEYIAGTLETAGPQLTESAQIVLSKDVLHHLASYEVALEAVGGFVDPRARWLILNRTAAIPIPSSGNGRATASGISGLRGFSGWPNATAGSWYLAVTCS
jgi:hypothetical protein